MENLNQRQQQFWIIKETVRQLILPITWALKAWADYGVEIDRRTELATQLQQLTDDGLIDRILENGPVPITQYNLLPRNIEKLLGYDRELVVLPPKSIDGILRAA